MASLNLDDQLREARARERIAEQKLGSTIVQPFTGLNSGNRKLMWAIHHQHKMNLIKGEAPFISTGNENEFLKYSSSYYESGCKKMVIGRVNKFEEIPNLHYWLVLVNLDGPKKGDLDLIERTDYVHTTESYGFPLDTKFLDTLKLGSEIDEGTIIKCPDNVDEFGNVMDGANLMTAYMSSLITQEDGYLLTETAASKLGTILYHPIYIQLNDNDIMLNLYGNDVVYKVMPNIGEDIKNGILLAIRRQNNADALFSQTWDRLKTIMHPVDKEYTLSGTLIDIDIFSNNFDQLENGANSQYHTQIRGYLENKYRYCHDILTVVNQYRESHPEAKMSYRLQELYVHSRDTLEGYDHHRNNKKYSGSIITLIVRQLLPLKQGDKITNRYGGKGVVSKIIPDYMAPRIDGEPINVFMNKGTVSGRLNYGQLFEIEINFRSIVFLEHLFQLPLTVDEKLQEIKRYMSFFSQTLADHFQTIIDRIEESERRILLDSYTSEGIIRLAIRPLTDRVTIDTLIALDDAYPWMQQKYLEVPMISSNGKLRYIKKSLRPIVAGYEFFIRLKQYAKEKFSVISISTVNLRNENSKSRAGKLYEEPFPNTPIKMGAMETEDMTHMDSYKTGMTEITLMLYSSSSEMRNKFFNLYFSDPVNINIELDESSSSRSAEIFAAYFKQLCDKFVFEKHLREPVKCPWDIKIEQEPPWSINIKEEEIPWHINGFEAKPKEEGKNIVEVLIDEDKHEITTDIGDRKDLHPIPWSIKIEGIENAN